jgi:uncharacterized protein YcfL
MRKTLIIVVSSVLLLTGCSANSESKPRYDELEMIRWNWCIDQVSGKSQTSWVLVYGAEEGFNVIEERCRALKPKLIE